MIESKILTSTLAAIENNSIPALGFSFPKHTDVKPGQHIPKAETAGPVTYSSQHLSEEKTYLLALLDLDAPAVSLSFLSPILHLLQPGGKISGDHLTFAQAAIFPYHPAGPPPGVAPHRYVFLVYEQPEGFDAGKFTKFAGHGLRDRIRWNWDGFVKENALGEVVAASYFKSN